MFYFACLWFNTTGTKYHLRRESEKKVEGCHDNLWLMTEKTAARFFRSIHNHITTIYVLCAMHSDYSCTYLYLHYNTLKPIQLVEIINMSKATIYSVNGKISTSKNLCKQREIGTRRAGGVLLPKSYKINYITYFSVYIPMTLQVCQQSIQAHTLWKRNFRSVSALAHAHILFG